MSELDEVVKPLIRALKNPKRNPGQEILSPKARFIFLRNVHFEAGAGRLDLLIVSDEPSLILIEAKRTTNRELKHAAAGQLLLYYAHALKVTRKQLRDELRRAAGLKWQKNAGLDKIASRAGVSVRDVFGWLARAKTRIAKNDPMATRAYLAVNSWNQNRDDKRIGEILRLLRSHHLPFGIVICSKRGKFLKVPKGFRLPKDSLRCRASLRKCARPLGTS